MPPVSIDINADLGESVDADLRHRDLELMRFITSANIACGGHAGDAETMKQMLAAAQELGVAAGAHASYPDRKNFGRVTMPLAPEAMETAVREQIENLLALAEPLGVRIAHVKAHGALYHDAREPRVAEAIGRAVLGANPQLMVIGQAGSAALEHWRAMGLRCAAEAFADRAYQPDGTLRSRSEPGAVLSDPTQAVGQALDIALRGRVSTPDGKEVAIRAETICIHSDTPNATEIAREVKRRFAENGIRLASLGSPEQHPHSALREEKQP